MRIRKYIGPIIVISMLLVLTSTYVGYMEKVDLMQSRGVVEVALEGSVYLSGGQVYAVIEHFNAEFNAHPEIPTYTDYLNDMFSSDSDGSTSVSDNQTFVEVHISIISYGDGIERTLLDKTLKVAYVWAGGDFGTDGQIASFEYNLDPYVAYHEYSPYKITCQIEVDGSQVTESEYLTVPDLSEGVV